MPPVEWIKGNEPRNRNPESRQFGSFGSRTKTAMAPTRHSNKAASDQSHLLYFPQEENE